MEISNVGKSSNVPAPHAQFKAVENSASPDDLGLELRQLDKSNQSQLLTRLQMESDARHRLLVEIQAKVQLGVYLNRAEAEKAAKRILG
ncbi:MAG TPA: hypothetical protein PKD64_07105 [Pirellulaceae bacterium]|mgnify:CR=1 FL=1|nr:hypothetical protein [Pirellulaceae bacterium]HMO91952.1 hypothetical protein [Pirellulaceae bacterium]HMP68751.1 hypothetical protein [Pirellulaceae bacterium]